MDKQQPRPHSQRGIGTPVARLVACFLQQDSSNTYRSTHFHTASPNGFLVLFLIVENPVEVGAIRAMANWHWRMPLPVTIM
jgi:hypothetical protein